MNRNVKALLIKKGIKQKEIAAEYRNPEGKPASPGLVSGVIGGHHESRPLKQFIADRLGIPYKKLWGKAA